MTTSARVAYFSMEIGLDEAIPTYSGGLGILAGDTIRSAADLSIPMIAVTLLSRKGYFRQHIDDDGRQREEPVSWPVRELLTEMPERAQIEIEGRPVVLRAWRYQVTGATGFVVPVYFLDTDLEENSAADRTITDHLYGGDDLYRLTQEVVLGIGGTRMLRALGYTDLERFHMNEGHSSLLGLELLARRANLMGSERVTPEHVEMVRPLCVFTTHTPVDAGHDKFPLELVHRVLGPSGPFRDREEEFCPEGELNLTYLALAISHYINGVAKKHAKVSKNMFASYSIDSITNGVHAATWAAPPMRTLFDRYIPDWREDNAALRYAVSIPTAEIRQVHQAAKWALIDHVNNTTHQDMDPDVATLVFARRATEYKRADLIFTDIERLRSVSERAGPIQLVFAGKAHPQDDEGKELIRQIFGYRRALAGSIKIAYLVDYDMALAKLMVAGADVWLNTPEPPLEASGTSGMKAAMNGVPSLSILDGWWIEGCIEGVTGWAIGEAKRSLEPQNERRADALALYEKLEEVVLPTYYRAPDRFAQIMRGAIALNASFFNSERMVGQYVTRAYFR